MTFKGRILSGQQPVTDFIDFTLRRDPSTGRWQGTFPPPDGFDYFAVHATLVGGIGVVEFTDGRRRDIYLRGVNPAGAVEFHLPGAMSL